MAWMRSGVRSPSAPQRIFGVAVLLGAAACNPSRPSSPAEDADRGRIDAGAAAPTSTSAVTAAPSASAAPSTGTTTGTAAAACKADADCATWSSYCQEAPCVCRVYGKDEKQPQCAGSGNVACFADPCMNKTAACQDGRCVLVMGSPR